MRRGIVQPVNRSWVLLDFELAKVKLIQILLLKLSSSCWFILKGLCHLVWVPDTFVLINQPEREKKKDTDGLKVDRVFFYFFSMSHLTFTSTKRHHDGRETMHHVAMFMYCFKVIYILAI